MPHADFAFGFSYERDSNCAHFGHFLPLQRRRSLFPPVERFAEVILQHPARVQEHGLEQTID